MQLKKRWSGSAGYVFEPSFSLVTVENHRIPVPNHGVQSVHFRERMTVHQQQVLPAVVVKIEKAATPSHVARVVCQTGGRGHIVELPFVPVVIQRLALVGEI